MTTEVFASSGMGDTELDLPEFGGVFPLLVEVPDVGDTVYFTIEPDSFSLTIDQVDEQGKVHCILLNLNTGEKVYECRLGLPSAHLIKANITSRMPMFGTVTVQEKIILKRDH